MSRSEDLVEQGVAWLVQLQYNQPDAHTVERFERWLETSPEHEQAWQRVNQASERFANLPPALSRSTLQGASRRINRRQGLKLLGLCVGVGVLGLAGSRTQALPGLMADYRSGVGERRQLALGDDLQVQLNSATALDIDVPQRRMHLHYGELLADAGQRPLQLTARDGSLQALGRFLLRQNEAGGSLLAVQEGQVALTVAGASASVAAGERVQFDGLAIRPARDSGLDPWGWSDGVLSARGMPLRAFLAELSRYRQGLLYCRDEVAQLKVSGTFQLGDTDRVLALLAGTLPIRVDYRTGYWVTVGARA
ncbi:DUF4880 domain-containing protein [Aeromonas dhakensis]|uniref:DUF4880 domain-containing protein n=1 Tax=Aeromonas dhakensis TaxID=196024 RepID=UPI00357105DD